MPDLRALSPALQQVAIEELHENPDNIAEDLAALRTWIKQQPHLRARTSDQFLIAFLRGSKYSLEKAKSKFDSFYTLREKFPDFFKPPEFDEKFRELIRCGNILYLPTPLTEGGPCVSIVRNGAFSPQRFSFAELSQMRQVLTQILMLENDNAVISGLVTISDFNQCTASHLLMATPSNMRKVSQFSEQALPLRLKSTHFINTIMGFETVFNLIKPLLSQKMQSRMFVHGSNNEALFKEIPKSILPKDYGGDGPSIEELIDYWEQKVFSYKDYFEQEFIYGVDESLRISADDSASTEHVERVQGSFRKLNVE